MSNEIATVWRKVGFSLNRTGYAVVVSDPYMAERLRVDSCFPCHLCMVEGGFEVEGLLGAKIRGKYGDILMQAGAFGFIIYHPKWCGTLIWES